MATNVAGPSNPNRMRNLIVAGVLLVAALVVFIVNNTGGAIGVPGLVPSSVRRIGYYVATDSGNIMSIKNPDRITQITDVLEQAKELSSRSTAPFVGRLMIDQPEGELTVEVLADMIVSAKGRFFRCNTDLDPLFRSLAAQEAPPATAPTTKP